MKASVIVPTDGRRSTIRAALRSLVRQDTGACRTEVVVVDNDTSGVASQGLRTFCESLNVPLRYVVEPAPGLGAARHTGAREAHGEILIFIDDDVAVASGWLTAILDSFDDDSELGIVGGPSVPCFTGSVPGWVWDFVTPTPFGGWACGWLSLLDIGRTITDMDPDWIWGLNFAVRRSVFIELGGMHPDLVPAALQRWQGDGETGFTRKAKAAGVRSAYLHQALVRHVVDADRLTPEYFCRRAYYQGVCDSFTGIRAGVEPSLTGMPASSPALPSERTSWAAEAHDVAARTTAAYIEGYQFHQREAASDPLLLRWIRRPDYWQADIRNEVPSAPGSR